MTARIVLLLFFPRDQTNDLRTDLYKCLNCSLCF